jgi:hypothetical protein
MDCSTKRRGDSVESVEMAEIYRPKISNQVKLSRKPPAIQRDG